MSRQIRSIVVVGVGDTSARIAAALTAAGVEVSTVPADGDFADPAAGLAAADLVVEAGSEPVAARRDLLRRIDAAVGERAIVATTATAATVTELAVSTSAPHRVVGLRFALPPERPLVELTAPVVSSPETVEAVTALLEKAGKTALVVGDRPGQIVTGLLLPYLNQAAGMAEARYASRDDIDAAMRLGCGLPLGPLQQLDLLGVDVVHDLLDALHTRTGDHRHAPAPILQQLIAAGRTGVAAGAGFYQYEAPGSTVAVAGEAAAGALPAVPRPVNSIGVIGSGTMATGIMEVFAKAGFEVLFVARGQAKVDAVHAAIAKSLDRAVSKGKLDATERDTVARRVRGTSEHADLAGVDLVVEAVVEDLEVKKSLFRTLDAVLAPGAVLATTTSSLPVVEIAAVTSRPRDVVGMHFFNPATVMRLVEVIDTVRTAPDAVATVLELSRRVGKHPVRCGDRAGFIVNALLFPYLNDAVALLAGNYADIETVDTAVREGLGYPMGPFALIDVVGLDVTLAIQRALYRQFREPGFAPEPLLEHLVTAGYLGRKTRRGFCAY